MKNLSTLPLATIFLAVLQQGSGLNSLALSTTHSRISVVSKSRLSVASTQLETTANDVDTIGENDDDRSGEVEFPPPLSSWDRTKRAATFYSTAIPIIANYYGLIGNIKIQELTGSEKINDEEIEVRAPMLCVIGCESQVVGLLSYPRNRDTG
jgi:hypothetical protein